MPVSTEHARLSVGQLEDMIRRKADGYLPPEWQQVYDMLSGSIYWDYIKKHAKRREVVSAALDGIHFRTAAQGICDASTAWKWIRHFLTAAVLELDRRARNNVRSDRELLKSLCSLTHGRMERGGSGVRPRVGATTCLGCTVSSA